MLQNGVINRFEKLEEIIEFDDQEQKVKRQNLTSLVLVQFHTPLEMFSLVVDGG